MELVFEVRKLYKIAGGDNRSVEEQILNEIRTLPGVKKIIILDIGEAIPPLILDQIHDECSNRDIRIYYHLGGASINHYRSIGMHSPPNKRYVVLWPAVFFKHTLLQMNSSYLNQEIITHNTEFNYPLLCMMGRRSMSRCYLMDCLAKHNLIEHNAISWHNNKENFCNAYEWQFWKSPSILKLTDSTWKDKTMIEHTFDQFIVPDEYHKSFLQIVPETLQQVPFITEKTVTPLLFKKFFITSGARYFHRCLSNLVFQLYDELVDYSFDDEPDYKVRINMIIELANKLISDPSNFSRYYELIKDKLEYNQHRAFKLALIRPHKWSFPHSNFYHIGSLTTRKDVAVFKRILSQLIG